mmetsp:Transcript_1921/g.4149  ORF Transcript_1921/g.4149 Transcript_1921/m.4149 type:complete len:1254 (-) Transcript_1921:1038-4799(-)|eukprot:CAMPEP_0172303158 /NCGR_PEP_ID=MMETSP1058-20130122/4734_1 /TAXON_ID=83371 /ORGANISM="Detonula confervacea, Strain CCMP 353" /LENGTH=1253 /DNA_ID=CAMNT_0013013875 /DNA_START=114 /DNA_END=3875 /DNA_ORIENTATION=+
MSSPGGSPATCNGNDVVSNGEATEAKDQKDGIVLPAALELERINIQNTSNGNHGVCITLDEWLQTRRRMSAQRGLYSGPVQCLQEEHLQERLRVAIATTKALSNVHEGDKGEGGRYCGQLSLENIVLDISDGYCDATLSGILDDDNTIPFGKRTKYEDMKQLGYILNAVFDGDGATSGMEMQAEPKTEEDQPTKKRGKSQQSVENLPLYLTCLVSSLITTRANVGGTTGQYESVKHVLGDLQMAAKRPQVYLKNTSWDDTKNNRLRMPHDSFYGRKSELSLVLHSLDLVLRFGQPVMVSVSGYAGTGKTALLNQIKRPLSDAGGFMIRGKFDKTKSPNTVIFSAFDTFFGEINDGDAAAQLKLRITETVGCGVGLLMSAIPNLRALMEEDECNAEDEYDIEDEPIITHQRWIFLICKLINAISDQSHPIAFYLDDLHWCDEATLDMIQAVVIDPDIRYCLFLGSYRVNAEELGVTKMLDSIQSHHGVRLVRLKLSCIEKESVNSFISELLCIPPCLCKPLSTVVHSKTGGLILFAVGFLKSLHEEGMIRFNLNTGKWQYNVNDIRQRIIPTDVVQHLSERMTRLPNNIQSLLKIAACLGFEFDTALLQMAIKGNKVTMAELIPYAIESGFLQEIPNKRRLIWAHDEIHLAAYNLIPLNKRQSSHLLIGTRIYMNTSSDDLLYKFIFDIVNNINVGLNLITSQEQRDEVSQLNLTAGTKAMTSLSFCAAAEYFMAGIGLLAEDCWDCNYKLTLTLHQSASKAFYIAGEFDSLKLNIDEQLCHANCLDDKLHAYLCLVRYLSSAGKLNEAVEKTLSILGELGESFPSPSEVTPDLIYKELMTTNSQLSLTKQDVLIAPRLTDARKLWSMRFMSHLLKYLFSTKPIVLPLVACRMVTLSSEHGYCSDSALGFLAYSHAVYNIVQDIDVAYRWARISLCFPERFGLSLLPKLKCYFSAFTSFWKEPIQATCDVLFKSHQDLTLLGDVESAVAAIFNYCRQSLFSGKDLATAEKVCSSAMTKMAQIRQLHASLSHSSNHLIILKLSGDAGLHNPFEKLSGAFNGEIKNEDDILHHASSTGKIGIVQAIHFNRLFLAYWFKRYEEAAEMAKLYKRRMMMPLVDVYHALYEGLTAYHFARHLPNDPKWMEIGEKALLSFKTWKSHSTWNWENKFLLLEAECHFSKGELEKAEQTYTLAIESARRHKFVHEEGLGNELCSTFYTTIGNVDKAKCHISAARACYEKWGAFALVDLLDSSEKQ